MAENDIDSVLDHLTRIKNGGDVCSVKIDEIETLEMELRFLRTVLKYHHALCPDSLVKITEKAKLIAEMLSLGTGMPDECINVERLVSQLREFIEGNTSSRLNHELDDFYLLEYMDYLDKNLNDAPRYLLKSDPFLIKEIKILQKTDTYLKQLTSIQKKMRFLRYLYGTKINGYVDHEKLKGLRTQIQFMAENVGHFCLALWVNGYEHDANSKKDGAGNDTFNIESKPRYLLFLVVLVELEMKKIFLCELKASKFGQSRTFRDKKLSKEFSQHLHSLLVYLRQKKLKNFVYARKIDLAIEFLLVFLGDVPNHVIHGKRWNDILAKTGALVSDILCVIQMLLAGPTIKEKASKIDLCTIQILEKIEDVKAQVEERYKSLKYSPSNEFSTVGGLSFLDSLLRKLNEMLKSESSLDFMMKPLIGVLEKDLSSLTSVFRDVPMVQHKHDEILKDLQRRTINLAYEAEESIDSIFAQYNALWHLFCSLPATIKEIKHIHVEVTGMRFQDLPLKPLSVVESFKHLPTQHSNHMNDEEMVGFENEAAIIIHCLTRGTNELDVIPIVGMGGQGKTTIARKMYNKESIVSHFDVRAWCIISQTYNRRELLQEIFSQVTGSKDKGDKEDILADELRKSLMGKRYLIVLDDMWDCMAWDDLRLSFPNDEHGSRIIVTTRLEKVGETVMHHTDPYFLPFLTPDESCKLLNKKVFQHEDCPPELQDVSLEIAEKCKGLPLVIILVAGIIKRNKMEASWWHKVKDALFDYLDHESEEYSLLTMQLSYDYLPDYLKPCLLYMGMFPEDARIPVSKLISLWIAEGFVQNIESGRLMEEAAEDYLMDLIGSNVVMVSRRRYNGKVKCCQVHDVVLHFCLERSSEEKFMLAVKGDLQPSHWKESRVSVNYSYEHAYLGSKTRKPFHQHLRSLIITHPEEFDVAWNPFPKYSKLRLLRVLDLSSHRVDCLWSATWKPLVHLKYLAVRASKFHFHQELHLPHLETLIVDGLRMFVVFPVTFWKMKKLRHVEISIAVFDEEGMFDESSKLENLRKLRKVIIYKADRVDVLLRKCPNLQELDISFKGGICYNLESLTQLQSLRFTDLSASVSELYLPSTLKKLVLREIQLERAISFIAELPSLEYLQLSICPYSKWIEWCLGDIKFDKLKFLKLVGFDISRWDASEESFPLLETLVIKFCHNLKEIPPSFADILTLKQIKLIWCSRKSLEDSAIQIKEEVKENEGCDRVHITIIDIGGGNIKQL